MDIDNFVNLVEWVAIVYVPSEQNSLISIHKCTPSTCSINMINGLTTINTELRLCYLVCQLHSPHCRCVRLSH